MRRVRPGSGFTLIELLIVVVIIGLLAAMAIPKFNATKNKAYYAALKSDLKNLTTAEEAYFYEHQGYTAVLDSMHFTPSRDVVLTVQEATPTGWSASAYHPASFPHTCALYYGNAAALSPATQEGTIGCN